jgi:hypothetical protein
MEQTDQSTSAEALKKTSTVHFFLRLEARRLPLFFQLLGAGFEMIVPTDCSVKELLCQHLKIEEDYLENRIQTIIMNGKAVDDINIATVEEGSTLALSGAMPGLVGAILRREGVLAPMRRQISHNQAESAAKHDTGGVNLKLFNLVVRELGPAFLDQGVWIKGNRLQEFISQYADELMQGCKALELDGNALKIDQLTQIDLSNKSIFLQITTQ